MPSLISVGWVSDTTREMIGRRINLAIPEESTLVEKVVGDVPHSGNKLYDKDSAYNRTILEWISNGAKDDPADVAKVTEAVARIKRHTRLPVAVGFGVRTPEQAAAILLKEEGLISLPINVELEAGKPFKYTVTARWVERGQGVEMSKEVTGTPGEVVRVDFGR